MAYIKSRTSGQCGGTTCAPMTTAALRRPANGKRACGAGTVLAPQRAIVVPAECYLIASCQRTHRKHQTYHTHSFTHIFPTAVYTARCAQARRTYPCLAAQ